MTIVNKLNTDQNIDNSNDGEEKKSTYIGHGSCKNLSESSTGRIVMQALKSSSTKLLFIPSLCLLLLLFFQSNAFSQMVSGGKGGLLDDNGRPLDRFTSIAEIRKKVYQEANPLRDPRFKVAVTEHLLPQLKALGSKLPSLDRDLLDQLEAIEWFSTNRELLNTNDSCLSVKFAQAAVQKTREGKTTVVMANKWLENPDTTAKDIAYILMHELVIKHFGNLYSVNQDSCTERVRAITNFFMSKEVHTLNDLQLYEKFNKILYDGNFNSNFKNHITSSIYTPVSIRKNIRNAISDTFRDYCQSGIDRIERNNPGNALTLVNQYLDIFDLSEFSDSWPVATSINTNMLDESFTKLTHFNVKSFEAFSKSPIGRLQKIKEGLVSLQSTPSGSLTIPIISIGIGSYIPQLEELRKTLDEGKKSLSKQCEKANQWINTVGPVKKKEIELAYPTEDSSQDALRSTVAE